MRFYTAKRKDNGKEEVLVSFPDKEGLFQIKELGLSYDTLNALIRGMKEEELRTLKKTDPSGCACVSFDDYIPLAPIPQPLQDVICLGINYDEHALEADRFSSEAFGGDRPATIYFSKRVNEAVGDRGVIPAYEGYVEGLDYESELGVVLFSDTKGVSEEEALSFVFGYTIINDISARNLQTRHKQWYLGKSLDGFLPMGPCIVTPDELTDPACLSIKSYVNGELRQSSNTRFMIKSTAGAISELSRGMTLKAGTIIATGTPAGVGMGMVPPCFMKKGDVVVCEIEGIGRLENTIV